jgi:hypothetical protein
LARRLRARIHKPLMRPAPRSQFPAEPRVPAKRGLSNAI